MKRKRNTAMTSCRDITRGHPHLGKGIHHAHSG
jgi:hypothetical protein